MSKQYRSFVASTVCETGLELIYLALRNIIPELAPKLRLSITLEERASKIRELGREAIDSFPWLRPILEGHLGKIVQNLLDADFSEDLSAAISGLSQARVLVSKLEKDSREDTTSYFTWKIGSPNTLSPESELSSLLSESVSQTCRDIEFVAHVMSMCAFYRKSSQRNLKMSDQDVVALNLAEQLVETGTPLPNNYASLETSPTRKHKTYLSFADPGDGHLAVTTQYPDLLNGLVVHIEYIDRDGIDDTDSVEAYRIPSVRNAARIRLRVGDETPCSVYVGRPHFEGGYATGQLKAAHSIASTCSAMFRFGIAECKISMDSLTASEAVSFMRAVAGNVTRDPDRQRLTGAFNVNRPITDDRIPNVKANLVEEKEKVAKLAATLVQKGNFDKIAWDGSSNKIGSLPLIGQLTRVQLLDLVHHSHSLGLETYISAGMKPSHMFDATIIGVGGVGIGTSLHEVLEGQRVGPILQDLVRQALIKRDNGAREVAGEAAKVLAQMDWAYHEGSLPRDAEASRDNLFNALRNFLNSVDESGHNGNSEHERPLSDAVRDAKEKLPVAKGTDVARINRKHPTIEKAERILLAHGEGNSSPMRYERKSLDDLSFLVNQGRISAIQELLRNLITNTSNHE